MRHRGYEPAFQREPAAMYRPNQPSTAKWEYPQIVVKRELDYAQPDNLRATTRTI